MKTLKTILLIAAISLSFANVNAQDLEYAIDNAKKITLNNLRCKIDIKNHNSDKILIEVKNFGEISEKAKGLTEIYGGYVDNTNIGLSIVKSENTINISGASKRTEDAGYVFYIPENVSLKIDQTSPFADEDIIISDFSSELEIKTLNPGIELKNVTGPLTIHAINGEVKITFRELNQASPTSITTINGDLDVSLPINTKANVEMSTINGGLYTDFDIDFENEERSGSMKLIGGRKDTDGKINGGGVHLDLNSVNGSVYFRKK